MFHPIRALQRLAFRFYSGYYETEAWAIQRREAMERHPSAQAVK